MPGTWILHPQFEDGASMKRGCEKHYYRIVEGLQEAVEEGTTLIRELDSTIDREPLEDFINKIQSHLIAARAMYNLKHSEVTEHDSD